MGINQTIDSSSILTLNCFIMFTFPGFFRHHHTIFTQFLSYICLPFSSRYSSSIAYPFNPPFKSFCRQPHTLKPPTDTSTLLAAALFATATARPHNYFLILNRRKEAGKPKENHCNHNNRERRKRKQFFYNKYN